MAKILIVDDAYFVRIKVRNFLEGHGHEVFEGENGKHALTVYEECQPDLVFCDVTMPEMDGLTFLKTLLHSYPLAKVVMLTSTGEQSMLMEALAVGAKNFLVKPFDENKVIEAIDSILG
jgi:two-component system chemotaxis response regulator CheY